MKVYLLKDVEKVGIAGEILNVSDGFAMNFLIPKKLAVHLTPENSAMYEQKKKSVEQRKEVIATATSMLAEKIKSIDLTIRRKMHDGDKLYGSISPAEIADLLADKGVKVAKNQVLFDKSIKQKGSYEITIKLSSRLQPKLKLIVLPESAS
jgi:large subunit ribosomal protein L9